MKRIITLVFISINISVYAQWEQLIDVIPNLNDVQCITENTVIVVGDQGTIMKTTNGGLNWDSQSLDNNHFLEKVQFRNESVGYILGIQGLETNIFKTVDGGESWTLILNSNLPDITDISCINQDIIYVSFEDGSLKKSIDGGVNFLPINNDIGLVNIQFITENVGYATDGINVLKTINGGINWVEKFHVEQPTFESAIFYFINENTGFVKWQNDLFRTTDGGDTYTYLDSVDSLMLRLFAPSEKIIWGMSVEVPLNTTSILTMRGEIMDNGSFEKVEGWPQFRSMHFINPTLGYGVSSGGVIYKNTTGLLHLETAKAESKIKIFPNPTSDLLNIDFGKNSAPDEITIFNCLGSIVFKRRCNKEKNVQLDIKSFPKGVYIVEIKAETEYYRNKIIIK